MRGSSQTDCYCFLRESRNAEITGARVIAMHSASYSNCGDLRYDLDPSTGATLLG